MTSMIFNLICGGIILVGFLYLLLARALMKNGMKKHRKEAGCGLAAQEVADIFFAKAGVTDLKVTVAKNRYMEELLDMYLPKSKTLRLSRRVYGDKSLGAYGVIAHWAGVSQVVTLDSVWMKIAQVSAKPIRIGKPVAVILVVAGLLAKQEILVSLGLGIVALIMIYDMLERIQEEIACRKALAVVDEVEILSEEEKKEVKEMVRTCKNTYGGRVIVPVLTTLKIVRPDRSQILEEMKEEKEA